MEIRKDIKYTLILSVREAVCIMTRLAGAPFTEESSWKATREELYDQLRLHLDEED